MFMKLKKWYLVQTQVEEQHKRFIQAVDDFQIKEESGLLAVKNCSSWSPNVATDTSDKKKYQSESVQYVDDFGWVGGLPVSRSSLEWKDHVSSLPLSSLLSITQSSKRSEYVFRLKVLILVNERYRTTVGYFSYRFIHKYQWYHNNVSSEIERKRRNVATLMRDQAVYKKNPHQLPSI